MKNLLLGGLLFLTCQCLVAQKLGQKELVQLKTFMQGSFSSGQQAKSDTSFLPISLEMKQVWTKRKDGYWLYVEQAQIITPAKPYQQRMYHLYLQDDTILVSQVFEFKDPSIVVGWWKEPRRFDSLKFYALGSRIGCEVYLKKNKQGEFTGNTLGKECESTIKGASYATSEVIINKSGLRSWDRGWDADGKQVWGSINGPYIFKKITQSK